MNCCGRGRPRSFAFCFSHFAFLAPLLRISGLKIARVTLEIALRREFDYIIPPELEGRVEVGTRVKVPFGSRQVLGVVTALAGDSPHTNLRAIVKVIGAQSLVTPKVLNLARWIADYYCCPVEIALKSVLPEAVRKEKEGWRERLFVRAQSLNGDAPKLTKRQQEVWNIIEEWRELALTELLRLTGCTPDIVRRLEDKGLVKISTGISERDPYADEEILPTASLAMNPEQSFALAEITRAVDGAQSKTFLLHGVTGSGKTEVYLQAIAQ